MFKLSSSRGSGGLSIGFDRSRNRRQGELTNNKKTEGKHHVRNFLKDMFDFAEYQQTATFGLGYKLTLTRNTDNAVLNEGNAITNAKIKIIAIEWYVPHYTPSPEQRNLLMNSIMKKMNTELKYPERSVFTEEVKTQNLWTFQLGTQEGM